MANYDYFMELERARRGQEPQLPSYLQYRPAPPPAPWTPSESGFYRGAPGTPEEFSFTNIPDVAQRGGLRGYSFPEAQAILPDGSEYYGKPLGEREWRDVEAATRPTPSPPAVTGTTDDYASKMEMGRKIIDKAMAKGIPIAEIKQYLQMKGYDMEPSKPMEVEPGKTVIDPRTGRVIYKAEAKVEDKAPGTIETAEGVFQWNPESNRFDIPLGKGKKGSEGLEFGDKEIIKKTLTEIPKLKREATTAATSIDQIDKALILSTTGVTGKGGQLKAFLAPYVETVGIPSESMNDAQKYQLLTRAIIGPMRLEIVGPGPVSEWEQKLMQQISGGGGAAKDAAQELLSHWKRLSENRLDAYNDTLTGFSEIYPAVTKVYKPIERKKTEAQPDAAATGGGDITQEDLEFTAQKHGITVEEVKRRMGVQ